MKLFLYLYGEDKDKMNKGNKNMGNVSDGYHTFNDLYKQRMILFATLVGLLPDLSWKTKRHENGEPCFPDSDYFLVTIETPEGNYGYHFDMKYWNHFKCKEIEKAKTWDGYTEDDAYRLFSLFNKENEKHQCQFPNGVSIKPDGIHETYPHIFNEMVGKYENVTVEVWKCKKCGAKDISWFRQPDTVTIFEKEGLRDEDF